MNIKLWAILDALIQIKKPNTVKISNHTEIPKSTVERNIALLRNQYQMDIKFIPPQRTGYYKVQSWGLFESGSELKKYLVKNNLDDKHDRV